MTTSLLKGTDLFSAIASLVILGACNGHGMVNL